jgi:hypothetical protein
MLNKYEHGTLVALAIVTSGLCLKFSIEFALANEEKSVEKQKTLQELEISAQASANQAAQRAFERNQKTVSNNISDQSCATNNSLPICSMNIVPIDPTPAEISRQNSRLPR